MKYIIYLLLVTGCTHHHYGTPCKDGSYRERAARPAMVQASTKHITLRLNVERGKKAALVLTEDDLNALECSINKYRELNGQYHPYSCRQE